VRKLRDDHSDVVLVQRVVVESFTIHVYDEAVALVADSVAVGGLQHPGAVDRDMPARVTEEVEDGFRMRGNFALHLEPLTFHELTVSDD